MIRDHATGEFWFRLPGRQVGVTLQDGQVVQVTKLPELLYIEGRHFTASINTGDMLNDIGAAVAGGLPPSQAMEAASLGLGRFLARVANTEGAAAAWDEDVSAPKGSFPLTAPLLRAFSAGLQEARAPERIRTAWKASRSLHVSPTVPADQPVAGLDPVAARALRFAGREVSLAELVDLMVGGNPSRGTKTWWAIDLLLLSGLMELGEPKASELWIEDEEEEEEEEPSLEELEEDDDEVTRSDTASDPLRADPLRADPAVVRMHRQHRKLLKMHPLEALDIKVVDPDEEMSTDVVREAFRRAAKRYHPDRFLGEQASMRRAAALCFQVLGEYKSLMEEPEHLKAELLRIKAERAGRAHVLEDDRIKAKVMYKRALGFFRNRAYVAARDGFAEAIILDPDARLARARHVHTRAVLKELPYDEAFMQLEAIEAEDVAEKIEILYLTAWLLKLLGKEKQAMKRYRAILERNPDHREALREVRLWDKRVQEKKKASEPASGFFRSRRGRKSS